LKVDIFPSFLWCLIEIIRNKTRCVNEIIRNKKMRLISIWMGYFLGDIRNCGLW